MHHLCLVGLGLLFSSLEDALSFRVGDPSPSLFMSSSPISRSIPEEDSDLFLFLLLCEGLCTIGSFGVVLSHVMFLNCRSWKELVLSIPRDRSSSSKIPVRSTEGL